MGEEYGQMAAQIRGGVASGAEQSGQAARVGVEGAEVAGNITGQESTQAQKKWGDKQDSGGAIGGGP